MAFGAGFRSSSVLVSFRCSYKTCKVAGAIKCCTFLSLLTYAFTVLQLTQRQVEGM